MKQITKIIKNNKYLVFLVIVYTLLFYQMTNVFMYSDDYDVTIPINSSKTIVNLVSFIFDKMNFFWFKWSGRLVGHFSITSLLTLFGINGFRVFNCLFVLLLTYVVSKTINLFINKKILVVKLMLVFSIIILGMNIYFTREILYWSYSAVLYLWWFIVTFLIISILYKNKQLKKPLLTILIIIQNFVLEQYGIITIVIIGGLWLEDFVRNKKINKQYIYFLAVAGVSLLVSSLAPGNSVRLADSLKNTNDFYSLSLINQIKTKLCMYYSVLFFDDAVNIYTIGLSIIVGFNYFKKIKKTNNKLLYSPIIIILSTIILIITNDIFNFHDVERNFGPVIYYKLYNYSLLQIFSYLLFTLHLFSLLFCLYKILKSKDKILFYLFASGISASIVPMFLLPWMGYRFFFALAIVSLIIGFILYINSSKNDKFSILIILVISNIFKIFKAISYEQLLFLYIIIFALVIFYQFLKKKKEIKWLLVILLFTICLTNSYKTARGYSYNREVFTKNSKIIKSVVDVKEIELNLLYENLYGFEMPNNEQNNYVNPIYKKYYNLNGKLIIWK